MLVKGKKVSSKKYVPDAIIADESDTKYRKKGLEDKMNRAPEFNKGLTKRNKNSSIKI